MFKIINVANQEKIEKVLKNGQGRATARTIDFYDLEKIVEKVDKEVEQLPLKKKELDGLVYVHYPQHEIAKSYKYVNSYMCTTFRIKFEKGKWRFDLESVTRESCGYEYLSRMRDGYFSFTDEQKELITKRILEEISRVIL